MVLKKAYLIPNLPTLSSKLSTLLLPSYSPAAHFCHHLNTLQLCHQFTNVVTSFYFSKQSPSLHMPLSLCHPCLSRGSREVCSPHSKSLTLFLISSRCHHLKVCSVTSAYTTRTTCWGQFDGQAPGSRCQAPGSSLLVYIQAEVFFLKAQLLGQNCQI